MAMLARFAKSLVQTVTGIAPEDFDDWVDARGDGRSHAPFFAGAFAEAVRTARRSDGESQGRGLVLLWFHEAEDEACLHLCKEVWPHPRIAEELSTRYVPWGGDVCRFEAGALMRVLGVTRRPALVVVQGVQRGTPGAAEWPRGCHFRVLQEHHGKIEAASLLRTLQTFADRIDGERRQQAAWREQMQQMREMAQGLTRSMEDARVQRETLQQAEEEERPVFPAVFESKYNAESPPVFDGNFAEALKSARSEKRLLLVWLYGESDNDEALGKLVGGEVFSAFITEYYILWPGDAERWLMPKQLRELLRLQTPAVAVLQPLSVYEAEVLPWGDARSGSPMEFPADSAWSLQGCWEGVPDEEALMAFLAEHGDRAQAREQLRAEERGRALEHAAVARAIREEQDREFEESLEKDRAAAAAGDAAEIVHRAPQVSPVAVDEKSEKRAALAAKRRGIAEQMLAAGDLKATLTGNARCELILRFPNGRRASRVFSAQQTLSVVYAWAECCGEICGLEGSERFDVPEAFVLTTTYPRALLRDREKSLLELQLVPNAVLALCSEDD